MPRQTLMVAILASLLEIPVEQISAETSFAEQGLDSLLALRFTRELQDATGIQIDPEWMYDFPSIRDLDRFIDSLQASATVEVA